MTIAGAILSALALGSPSLAAATPTATNDRPPTIAAPSPEHGATIADIVVPVPARSRPGAGRKVWRVGTATSWSGEPQFLLVLGSAVYHGREWLRVLLPIRPNHTTGWIPRDNVTLLSTRYWTTVDKRARTVTIYPLGSSRSHGCIRIDNGPIDWMAARLPQGAPVQITG